MLTLEYIYIYDYIEKLLVLKNWLYQKLLRFKIWLDEKIDFT